MKSIFYPSTYKRYFDFSFDRYSSILHSRLRLNCCALKYHLYKIDAVSSPICDCGDGVESINHYFLCCSQYAALRPALFSGVAQIMGDSWATLSDTLKTNIFLRGSETLSLRSNELIFYFVQRFINQTQRFVSK